MKQQWGRKRRGKGLTSIDVRCFSLALYLTIQSSNPILGEALPPSLTTEKPVAQRGEGADPGSHSYDVAAPGLEPRSARLHNLGSFHYKTSLQSNIRISNVV